MKNFSERIDNSHAVHHDRETNNFSNVDLSKQFVDSCNKIFHGLHLNTLCFSQENSQQHDFSMNHFLERGFIFSGRNVVKKFTHKETKISVAIKYINIPMSNTSDFDSNLKKLMQEIVLQKTVSNFKNVTQLYGCAIQEEKLLLCMEFMDMSLTDLYTRSHKNRKYFSEKLLGYIGVNILDALMYLKSKNVIHRDLKPLNILINRCGQIKLCDFGTSRFLDESFAITVKGTFLYWPPELFTEGGAKYDVRFDVWALGITLAESSYGKYPIVEEISDQNNYFKIQKSILQVDASNLINKCLVDKSDVIKEFVGLCISKVENRPKYDELKETKFYQTFSETNSPRNIEISIKEIEQQLNIPENLQNQAVMINNNETQLHQNMEKSASSLATNMQIGDTAISASRQDSSKRFVVDYSEKLCVNFSILEQMNLIFEQAVTLEVNQIRYCGENYTCCYGDFQWPMSLEWRGQREIYVKKVLHYCMGREVAVRFISLQNAFNEIAQSPTNINNIIESELREIRLLKQLSNSLNVEENFIDFYGFVIHTTYLLYIMEIMDMSLREFYGQVHENTNSFPETILGYITVQTIKGLTFLQANNMIDLDLTSDNILVNQDGRIKLSDRSLAIMTDDSLYRSPERLNKQKKNRFIEFSEDDYITYARLNIWSLGIILCEVVYNGQPYDYVRPVSEADVKWWFKKKYSNKKYDPETLSFVETCLYPYDSRPEYESLMEKKFYQVHCEIRKEAISKEILKHSFTENFSIFEEMNLIFEQAVTLGINQLHYGGKNYKCCYRDFQWPKSLKLRGQREIYVNKVLHFGTGREMVVRFTSLQNIIKEIGQSPTNINNIIESKLREIRLLKQLSNSENFIDFYGFVIHTTYLLYIMEIMDMSLKEFYGLVHENTDSFPEKILGYITVQIIKGLTLFQDNKIDLDLTSDNILVNQDGSIKFSDRSLPMTTDRSPYWTPERLVEQSIINSVDDIKKYYARLNVWSLGIILCEVVFNGMPYKNERPNSSADAAYWFKENKNKTNKKYDPETLRFIETCLYPYECRPVYESLMEKKFYQDHCEIKKEAISKEILKVLSKKKPISRLQGLISKFKKKTSPKNITNTPRIEEEYTVRQTSQLGDLSENFNIFNAFIKNREAQNGNHIEPSIDQVHLRKTFSFKYSGTTKEKLKQPHFLI